MVELKEALTLDEQIERLITIHKLVITDKSSAKDILKKVNYYRLSAYGIGLKNKNNPEEYIDGITLEHIYRLYCFDSHMRNLLIHVIEQLEIQLRAQISNHLALKYGPEGYMDSNNFIVKYSQKTGNTIHERIISDFKKECKHQKNVPFVKHHITKYDGHFPIWVAVELLTFGNLSSLYDIMTLEDKKAISSVYATKPDYLSSWILALVEIRNICAHYSRLYNIPLKQAPFLYPESKKYRHTKRNKIFPALITIKRMLHANDLWQSFFIELEALMEEYEDVVKLPFMGFPSNWKEVLSCKPVMQTIIESV